MYALRTWPFSIQYRHRAHHLSAGPVALYTIIYDACRHVYNYIVLYSTEWLIKSILQLNPAKTEFMRVTTSPTSATAKQCRIKTLEALVHSEKWGLLKSSYGVWGSAVSSPSGVPQPKSNLVYYSLKIWDLVATISIIFLRINWPNLVLFKQ